MYEKQTDKAKGNALRRSCSSSTTRARAWRPPTTTPPCRVDVVQKATAQLSKLQIPVVASRRRDHARASRPLDPPEATAGPARGARIADAVGRPRVPRGRPRRRAVGARDPRADRVSSRPSSRGRSSATRVSASSPSTTWDPTNEQVRRARVHLRHGRLVGDRARARGAAQPRHRAVHERARAAPAAQAGRLRRRPARRDPVGRVRALGAGRARAARAAPSTSTSPTPSARSRCSAGCFGGPGERRELHDRRASCSR